MKKAKFIIGGISFIVLMTTVIKLSFFNGEVNASSLPFTAPSFSQYNKVSIGTKTFTVLGSDASNVKLLSDTATANDKKWGEAGATLNSLPSTFGTLANPILTNKFSMPLEADLSASKNGNALHASIPTISSNWWLGDASLNNRSKYLTGSNSYIGENIIQDADYVNNACTTKNTTEVGVLPTIEEKGKNIETNNGSFNWTQYASETGSLTLYADTACAGPIAAMQIPKANKGGTFKFLNGHIGTNPILGPDSTDISSYAVGFFYYTVGFDISEDNLNKEMAFTVENNKCYTSPVQIATVNGPMNSYQYLASNPITFYATINRIAVDSSTVKCPGLTHPAGIASVRPMLTLPMNSIVLGNSAKRQYNPATKIEGSVPASTSNPKYLTLLSSNLSATLTSGAKGVTGSTLKTSISSDKTITLPITVPATMESKKYISAIGTDTTGKKVYGVLGEINGTNGTLTMDVSNLVKDDTTSFTLQLFEEDPGSGDTAYISSPTTITVEVIQPQKIAFSEGSSTTSTYGTDVVITSSVTSALVDQANTDIVYSIIDGTLKAEIVSQSYNPVNGTATATIRPKDGTGTFKLSINKAGDDKVAAASAQTLEIALEKKDITVHPLKPSKVYKIGDTMPTFASASEQLSNNDVIPSTLIPILTPLNASSPSAPDEDGKVKYSGTWTMGYASGVLDGLTEFTNKYNVTLQGYDATHKDYVFEAALDTMPDNWIEVTPEANDDGWNKQTVTIAPSQTAKDAGYDVIELLDSSDQVTKFGASIAFASETNTTTPNIRLKKGDILTPKYTVRELKIDLSNPSVSASVEKENTWVSDKKIVTITATDAISSIKSVNVKLGENAYTTTKQVNGTYTFEADKNGSYAILVQDLAGNEITINKTVAKIDTKEIELTMTPQAKPSPPITQDITIARAVGDSGIASFKIEFKEAEGGTFEVLEELAKDDASFTYVAGMNGIYKVTLVNGANVSKSESVTITGLTPPLPVTNITAKVAGKEEAYLNDTWTSNDVVLQLSNANTEIPESDAITWEVSEDNGTTWNSMGSETSKTISSATWMNKKFTFRATSNNGLVDAKEPIGRSITVKIDKSKPTVPSIEDADTYGEDKWFADDVTVKANMTPKESTIAQTIQYKVGASSSWNDTSDGSYTVVGNGQHTIQFRVIDMAGNISDETDVVKVNINSSQPSIVIKLNNDPIKSLINDLTFGLFFKETINVDMEANFGLNASGKVYYIVDNSEAPSIPENDDVRWIEGTSTSITPDAKVMIYVKAISDAGIIARDSSIYSIYADASKPIISLPENASNWNKEAKLELQVEDAMAGIDTKSLTYNVDGGTAISLDITDHKAMIQNLPDGEHTVNVSVKDYSSNMQTATTKVKIDKTSPIIGTSSPNIADWAKEKKISVAASDALSGVADGYPQVKTSDGVKVNIKEITPGNYVYDIVKNDTYTITMQDKAGNEKTATYTESKIDTQSPTIENLTVADANAWKSSKMVTFDVEDVDSDVKRVEVSYVDDGKTITKNVTKGEGNAYSFKATENATFTIFVEDNALNQATQSIEVSQIDTNGIAIKDISDINPWTKDSKKVSFKAQAGMSGLAIDYPKVLFNGAPVDVILEDAMYSFTANALGTYTILVKNNVGDEESEQLDIQTIDVKKPVIEDISDNTTSTTYREPQTITFHAKDYNTNDKTKFGSGIAEGYPKVSYMQEGTKVDVVVSQDNNDDSLYSFLADKNTIYTIELMDRVNTGMVTQNILVDHILKPEDISELQVIATSGDKAIASGVWTKEDITFTITNGLSEEILTSYQVAMSDGALPQESDWHDISSPYTVSTEQKGTHYFFRTAPFFASSKIYGPFVVNIDKTSPTDVEIQLESVNANAFARFINTISLGNWMKEEQRVIFHTEDNLSTSEELQILYQEERAGTKGEWKHLDGNLQYQNTSLILHAKAVDLAGNESTTITQKDIQIESEPPILAGFTQDDTSYIGRRVTYEDDMSGIAQAVYQVEGGEETTFTSGTFFKEAHTYTFSVVDNAGNETSASFQIKALLDIDTITGSESEKSLIDDVENEYLEAKDSLHSDEQSYYEDWIQDARDAWLKKQKTIVETEDKTSKVEGVDDTIFPPETTLIVEEVQVSEMPQLPRKALFSYDVYLKNGSMIMQPNGDVKVYLPYDGTAEPILYEIDEEGNVREIDCEWKDGQIIFTTQKLMRYAISNVEQEEIKKDIDIDSDGDGSPDVNVDVDCDGTADINIDTNGDGFPDINIDTTGDGKANYNVDLDDDGIADLNIGLLHKKWKPDICKMGSCVKFCTDSYYKPYLNIDTDNDERADMNVDINDDGEAELNIDLDRDDIPDLDIDSDGNGKAEINVDENGDGIADYNLLRLSTWKPDKDVTFDGMDYDTMADLKPMYNIDSDGDGTADENMKDNTGNALILSGQKNQTTVSGAYKPSDRNGIGGAGTGDSVNYLQLFTMFALSTSLLSFSIIKKRRMRNKKLKDYGL